MCQGDSIYDLVDSRDHAAVQAELASGPPLSANFPEERVFICRLNLTRAAAKRQLQYHKVWATPNPAHMNLQFILLQGRYIHPAEYYQNLQETGGQQVGDVTQSGKYGLFTDSTNVRSLLSAFDQPRECRDNGQREYSCIQFPALFGYAIQRSRPHVCLSSGIRSLGAGGH